MSDDGSPYLRALGPRIDAMHPTLQRYFATIPNGSVGVGEGVFVAFGTTHRWLRPILSVLARYHVIVPGYHERVPFRVENRTQDGRQTATRTLQLPDGPWAMMDSVSLASPGHIVDTLGRPALVEAIFRVDVAGGGLQMVSTGMAVRLGRLRVPVPALVRPRIALGERRDDDSHDQHVELTVDVPFIGRVYEYRGKFSYHIQEDS